MKHNTASRAPSVPSASARIQQHKQKIIELWEQRVILQIPAAKVQRGRQLRNSLPLFLDQLSEALSPLPLRPAFYRDVNDISQAHGEQRSTLEGYSLHEMLTEFKILRETLIGILEEDGPLALADRDVILSAIEQGMAESGAYFMKLISLKENIEKERYRLVVEGTKDYAIIRMDPAGKILDWNSGAENIFQYNREEILGSDSRILFLKEDVGKGAADKEIETAISTGKAEDKRWHVKKDGTRFFANGIMNPLRDQTGNVVGLVKVLRDETESKTAEHNLKRSEKALREVTNQLRLVADAVPIHLLHLDKSERILFANKAAAEMWQLPIDKFVGRTIRDIVGDEAQKKLQKYTHQALNGDTVSYESDFIGPDGRLHTYLNTYTPDRTTDVAHGGFVVTGLDISDRKRMEVALKESEAKAQLERKNAELAEKEMHDFLMQTPIAMALMQGPEHRYTLVNPRYIEILGRNPEGKTIYEAFRPPEVQRYVAQLDEVYRSGKSFIERNVHFEKQNEKGELTQLYLEVHFHPFKDQNGTIIGVLAYILDTTVQVLARQKVEASKVALETVVESLKAERELRETFVATLSHDLRTPLTAAKMSTQLFLRRGRSPEDIVRIACRIIQNIDRADQMIRDLLDANQIRAGEKLPLEIDRCELREIASEALEQLTTVHGDRFVLKIPDVPIIGYWSCIGARRILENLCSNAIKYGSEGRPVTISLTCDDDAFVSLCVHNYGPAISPEDQKSLFEPFRRSASARTGGQKGWGLGLTLVKGLAEAHGGHVEVDSTPKDGTTFRVRLPLDARQFCLS